MLPERKITLAELRRLDGENDPMCIAYNGMVYDVSASRRWNRGQHENLHFPAQDLSGELAEAPHGTEVFLHPDVHFIGRLIDDNEQDLK